MDAAGVEISKQGCGQCAVNLVFSSFFLQIGLGIAPIVGAAWIVVVRFAIRWVAQRPGVLRLVLFMCASLVGIVAADPFNIMGSNSHAQLIDLAATHPLKPIADW